MALDLKVYTIQSRKINVASKDQSISINAESRDGICVVFMAIQCENENHF